MQGMIRSVALLDALPLERWSRVFWQSVMTLRQSQPIHVELTDQVASRGYPPTKAEESAVDVLV